jgi:hypothetical protein
MGGPLLPGEVCPVDPAPSVASLARQLGTLEARWRLTAAQLIHQLPPSDDLRLSLLRTLAALDEC